MNQNHVREIAIVSSLFGLVLVIDSLPTSLAIGRPLEQVFPDWVWSLAFCTFALFLWMFSKRRQRRRAAAALQGLTMLWVFVTVPRIINLFPSSVLYIFFVVFCVYTYFHIDKTQP